MTNPETSNPVNPFYVAVDDKDREFLKSLQDPQDMGNALRLWPDPHTKRGQAAIVPTHMTIMANTKAEREYVLYRLEQDRQSRLDPTAKATAVERLSKILDLHKADQPQAA